MATEDKVPSTKEVQEALQIREQALLLLILNKNPPAHASVLEKLEGVFPDPELVGLFKELESIKQKFNTGLQAEVRKLVEKAKELSENYLRHLLSVDSLPAIVTLPEDFNGKQATHIVTALESVQGDGNGPYGFVTVASYDNRSRSSERFFTHNGELHFASPDLY